MSVGGHWRGESVTTPAITPWAASCAHADLASGSELTACPVKVSSEPPALPSGDPGPALRLGPTPSPVHPAPHPLPTQIPFSARQGPAPSPRPRPFTTQAPPLPSWSWTFFLFHLLFFNSSCYFQLFTFFLTYLFHFLSIRPLSFYCLPNSFRFLASGKREKQVIEEPVTGVPGPWAPRVILGNVLSAHSAILQQCACQHACKVIRVQNMLSLAHGQLSPGCSCIPSLSIPSWEATSGWGSRGPSPNLSLGPAPSIHLG